jgi:hypothetical protein
MRIVRMLPVHNEADVLEQNFLWYAERGFETVVVDNESTDGSQEICRWWLRDESVLGLERLSTGGHQAPRLWSVLHGLARAYRPDYLVVTAADEFFEVGDGTDLRSAMEEDFSAGWTVLQFHNMEFAMTRRDDPRDPDPLTRMRYYSHVGPPMHRAYPDVEGLDLVHRLGHGPSFPPGTEPRVSPRCYVSRHYPLRTVEQARRKILRMRPTPERPFAHSHYLHLKGDEQELYDKPRGLARYEEDHRWDFTEHVLSGRLKQTRWALARMHRDYEDLLASHRALLARLNGDGGDPERSGGRAVRPAGGRG